MITLVMMKSLWPNGNSKIPGLIEGIVANATSVFTKYGITSNLLIAHVMAQISHECGAGTEVVENLSYSEVRMMQVWPSRFPNYASTAGFAHNPQALANKVYNGRMGNLIGSNDGWNFRGRGASQTTGREGYALLATKTGLPLLTNPDLINTPSNFLECGVADFIICGCLPYAKADDVIGVTKRLNGGLIGIDQRRAWLVRWKNALRTSAPLASPPTPVSPQIIPASPTIPSSSIAKPALIAQLDDPQQVTIYSLWGKFRSLWT